MNYAQTYHIGNYQPTRTETPKAIAPTIRRVRKLATKTQRRKRSTERQTAIRSDYNVTNDFLKCRFLPKLKTAKSVQACQKTERDFYQSLSRLAEHYNIEPIQSQHYGYPYNIALAMWDVKYKLLHTDINRDNLRLVQDSENTYLANKKRYDTGTTLYYIPVIPLFQMLQDRQRKQSAQLLLSVCSYLYRIANIPYYRQEETYLYWQYEMFTEWVESDENTEETQLHKRELRKAENIGNIIEQKINNRINLTVFEQRLKDFKSRNPFDHECWQIACDAFALYTEYPNASVFRNATIPEPDPYADDDNEIIGMEKYISFISDTKGWLFESLADCINNEFNEYGAMEEPTVYQPFDGSDITPPNLDFENRLFSLMTDLSGLLHNYKTTEK